MSATYMSKLTLQSQLENEESYLSIGNLLIRKSYISNIREVTKYE